MTDDETAPPPAVVAARLVLDRLEVERVPWWAAGWLADGFDGPCLRELAGLGNRDGQQVRDLLPSALAEMAVPIPDSDVAAAALCFQNLAERCLAGRRGERWVAQVVADIVSGCGYSDAVMAQPLAALYDIDDEWQFGWGRGVHELTAAVRVACAEQMGSANGI